MINRILIISSFKLVRSYIFLSFCFSTLISSISSAQNLGGTPVNIGINASVYANQTAGAPAPAGDIDWFKLGSDITGRNIIKQDAATVTSIRALLQSANYNGFYEARMQKSFSSVADGTLASQKYKLLADAVWARDHFGGTGGTDSTAFVVSSKNGQDPILWTPGAGNVLGKNDLIDIAAHMFREVDSVGSTKSNLWFAGLINRAEPGGSAYMDFEFFVNKVGYNKSTFKFNTGGPDMGHTSFLFDASGNITRIGDVLFNVSLEGGGTVPGLQLRIWMKRTDYNTFKTAAPANLPFIMGPNFDGAGTNAAFGYASIISKKATPEIFGYVNVATQKPSVPPWGTKNTKSHVYLDSATGKYMAFSVNELAANMTDFGIDHYLVTGYNKCNFPWRCFMVKTRSSASFTAALKDFIGPLDWGIPKVEVTTTNDTISCLTPQVTLTGSPNRDDVTYQWSTDYGNIVSGGSTYQAVVNKAGKYYLTLTLPNGCTLTSPAYTVIQKSGNPPITSISSTVKPNCNSQTNGTITITATGGTAPFSYSWTGPSYSSISKDLTSLASGNYNVTITDALGCQYSSTAINVPSATSNVSGVETNVSCYNGTNGSINITATGTAPYTYSWSNGKKIEDLTNIGAGSYTVNVTDSLGCTSSASFTITQPAAALSASIVKTNDTDSALLVGDGAANLTVTGGTTSYTYTWTGPSVYTSTDEDLNALKYGSYSVVVTDSKGCTATANTFIYEPERCDDTIDNDGDGLIDCNDPDCSVTLPVFTGDLQPCTGDSIYYTIASPVAGYTYTWTVPSTATIISGQGTSSLYMKWNTTAPGQLCVTPQSAAGCSGAAVCKTVSPKKEPATPTIITKS